MELSAEERKADYLDRLSGANEEALWVCAADKVHNATSIVADLRRTIDPETVWNRFSTGKAATAGWYRRVYERLREVGFDAPIMSELDTVSSELQKLAE